MNKCFDLIVMAFLSIVRELLIKFFADVLNKECYRPRIKNICNFSEGYWRNNFRDRFCLFRIDEWI